MDETICTKHYSKKKKHENENLKKNLNLNLNFQFYFLRNVKYQEDLEVVDSHLQCVPELPAQNPGLLA